MPAECDDLGVDLGDHGLAEVGLLEPDAAGFQQQHRQDRFAGLAVASRERERACDLAAGDFSQAAPLERPLDRHDHGGFAREFPARDDDAVIGLGHDPLERKPGGFQAIERAKQLAEATGIKERLGTLARSHLDDAPPRQEAVAALRGGRIGTVFRRRHGFTSSPACSSRNVTVPGVAPKSLISTRAACSKWEKNRSSTAFQTWA